jgi:hypothetical protein
MGVAGPFSLFGPEREAGTELAEKAFPWADFSDILIIELSFEPSQTDTLKHV